MWKAAVEESDEPTIIQHALLQTTLHNIAWTVLNVLCLPDSCAAYHRSVWDDYEADTELIGRGAFARVFRAIRREDGTPVAIKVIGRETKAFAQQRRGKQVVAIGVGSSKMLLHAVGNRVVAVGGRPARNGNSTYSTAAVHQAESAGHELTTAAFHQH